MKLRKLFYVPALASVCLPLFSCTEKEVLKPDFSVPQLQFTAPAEGGTIRIPYELDNPLPDAAVEVAPSEDTWLGGYAVGEGAVVVEVEANGTASPRQASFEVSYSALPEKTFTVVVEQTAASISFVIEVLELHETEAVLVYTPSVDSQTYLAMNVEKSLYDEFIKTDDELARVVLEQLHQMAEDYPDLDFPEFLEKHILISGKKEIVMKNLSSKTEYIGFCYAMDSSGNRLSDIAKENYVTKDVQMIDITFGISYDIKGAVVDMTVVPSEDGQMYYYDVVRQSSLAEYGMDLPEYVQYGIGQIISAVMMQQGVSIEQAVAYIASVGKSSFKFNNLQQETDYIGFAASMTTRGIVNSEVSSKEFRTGSTSDSDNDFNMSVTEVGIDSVSFSVTTTTDDIYAVVFEPKSDFEGMTDEQILEVMTDGTYDLSYRLFSGDTVSTRKRLYSDTDYYALVFGVESGVATTGLTKTEFRTLAPGDASTLTYVFEASDIRAGSMDFKITGTPSDALFWFGLDKASETAEDIEEDLFGYLIPLYQNYGFVKDARDFFRQVGSRGTASDNDLGPLFPDTDYRLWAVGINEKTGELAQEIVFSEIYHTLPQGSSAMPAGEGNISGKIADKRMGVRRHPGNR